jgi:V8-like Glu-specific endopeptidase
MRSVFGVFGGLVLGGLTACLAAPQDDPGEAVRQTQQAIFGGEDVPSSPVNDAVVALVRSTGPSSLRICTGTVIAPNLVLTARHCVTDMETLDVQCDSQGNARGGTARLGKDYTPQELRVYATLRIDAASAPLAVGVRIWRPDSTIACNTDIALVILDRNLPMQPRPVRLDGAATEPGERLTLFGYGEDENGLRGTRKKRDAQVLGVGPAVTESKTAVGNNEFETSMGFCSGDSGGPAMSNGTGAVIGVVSRNATCNSTTGHVYTSTAAFGALIRAAAKEAKAELRSEQGRPPPVAPRPVGDGGTGTSIAGNGLGTRDAGETEPLASEEPGALSYRKPPPPALCQMPAGGAGRGPVVPWTLGLGTMGLVMGLRRHRTTSKGPRRGRA